MDNVIDLEAARVMRRRRQLAGNAKCVLCGRVLKPDQVIQVAGGLTVYGCECRTDPSTGVIVDLTESPRDLEQVLAPVRRMLVDQNPLLK